MTDSTSALVDLVAALDRRLVCARELLDHQLDRLERLDGYEPPSAAR